MIRIACAALLSSQLITQAIGNEGTSDTCRTFNPRRAPRGARDLMVSPTPGCATDQNISAKDRPYFSRRLGEPETIKPDLATQWRNRMAVANPEAMPRALIGRELYMAHRFVEANPGLTRAQAEERFREAFARGKQAAEVNLIEGSTGYDVARLGVIAARGALGAVAGPELTVAGGAAIAFGGATGSDIVNGVTRYFDDFTRADYAKHLTPGQILAYNNYVDRYAMNDSRFEFARSELKKGVFALDPAGQDDLPRALAARDKDGDQAVARAGEGEASAAERYRKKSLQYLIDPRPTVAKKKLVEEAGAAALNEQTQAITQELAAARARREKVEAAEAATERRGRVFAKIDLVNSLASLSGNPGLQQFTRRLSTAGKAFYDVGHMTKAQIGANPAAAMNLYMLGFSALFASDSDAQSQQLAEIQRSIDRLQDQVQSFHDDMIQLFRAQGRETARGFELLTYELRKLAAGQRNVETLIGNILYEQRKEAIASARARQEADERVISEIATRCLPSLGPVSSYLAKNDAERCLVNMSHLALGNPSGVVFDPSWNRNAFESLTRTVAEVDGSLQVTTSASAAQSTAATNMLIRFLNRYPQYRTEASTVPAFGSMVDELGARADFRAGMAVTSTGGFRTAVFDHLVDQYEQAADRLLGHFKQATTIHRGRLPATARAVDPALMADAARNFGEPSVNRCFKTPIVNPAGYKEDGFDFGFGDRELDKSQAGKWAADRKRALETFDPNQMKIDVDFTRDLPPLSVALGFLRTERTALSDFNISYCFKRAEITKLQMTRQEIIQDIGDVTAGEFPGKRMPTRIFHGYSWGADATTKIGAAFELEIRAQYTVDGQTRDLPIGTFRGEAEETVPFFDPRNTSSLLGAVWNGTAFDRGVPGQRTQLFKSTAKDPVTGQDVEHFGFRAGLGTLLKLQPASAEVQQGREQFEHDYDARAGAVTPAIVRYALEMGQREVETMNDLRWQMDYLFSQGVDLNHSGARDVFKLILGNVMRSGEAIVRDASQRGFEVVGQEIANGAKGAHAKGEQLSMTQDLRPAPGGDVPGLSLLPGAARD